MFPRPAFPQKCGPSRKHQRPLSGNSGASVCNSGPSAAEPRSHGGMRMRVSGGVWCVCVSVCGVCGVCGVWCGVFGVVCVVCVRPPPPPLHQSQWVKQAFPRGPFLFQAQSSLGKTMFFI